MLHHPAFTFALALAAGVLAQSLALRLRVPGIVLLLLAGVLLGPDVLDVVAPAALGSGLQAIVGMSVAVILFEGGMNLGFDRLRREALTIRRLITIGALVTALGATLAARLIMGWEWTVALLFGTLVIVTGPTVITPLLRRLRVRPNVKTILQAEGVLIDPVGAIIAVVTFEVVITSATASSAALSLLGLPGRLGFGALAGVAGGFVIAIALKRRLVPDELLNIFALSMVILLYELCELFLPESGIMAAPLAGVIVGNMQHPMKRELSVFKEQLTVMLVGMLFVLLVANVRISEVVALGGAGIATVIVMMLVVRPVGVALSTAGSQLDRREKAFIAWLGPRGIVAAAMASLFAERLAEEGFAESTALRALVFLVIATTVVVQGGLSPIMARALGVRQRENDGWIIVGANPLARLLGAVLRRGGEEIVLMDTNPEAVSGAEAAGLRAVLGNASEERALLQADIEARRGLITLTPNESINLFLARRANELFHVHESIIGISQNGNVPPELVEERGKRLLFGRPVAMQQWQHRLLHNAPRIERWRFAGEERNVAPDSLSHDEREELVILPLAVERAGAIRPVTDRTRFVPADLLYLARPAESEAETKAHLESLDWHFAGAVTLQGADRRAAPSRRPATG
jgi:NhaP-type Na+/H+ or K+/H+ antiporter